MHRQIDALFLRILSGQRRISTCVAVKVGSEFNCSFLEIAPLLIDPNSRQSCRSSHYRDIDVPFCELDFALIGTHFVPEAKHPALVASPGPQCIPQMSEVQSTLAEIGSEILAPSPQGVGSTDREPRDTEGVSKPGNGYETCSLKLWPEVASKTMLDSCGETRSRDTIVPCVDCIEAQRWFDAVRLPKGQRVEVEVKSRVLSLSLPLLSAERKTWSGAAIFDRRG